MISLFSRPTMLFGRPQIQRVADLKTARLRLVAITPTLLRAEEEGAAQLGRMLRARVTEHWPPQHWEPHVHRIIERQCEDEPETVGWHRYVLLYAGRPRPVVVGCVGGFPKPNGEVEIGYSTVSKYQRRGFATEAASAFVTWLLMQDGVRVVSAQTFSTLPESVKVMKRCGMVFTGDGDEAGTVRYCRTH